MLVDSTSSSHSKKTTQQKISLFTILTCLLCSSKAKMAHICPNCSKFYCQQCIKNWIKQNNKYCPHCKNTISQNTIVNCNKLSQDLSSALQTLIQLQTPQQSQCLAHSIPQTYYCQTCTIQICSDCIVLQSTHRGHTITKLSKIKLSFNQNILSLLSKIRKLIKQLQKQKQQILKTKSQQQKQQYKIKIDILNSYIHKIRNQYQNNVNKICKEYETIVTDNKLQYMYGIKVYEDNLKFIKQISKINLVKRDTRELENVLRQGIQVTGQQFANITELKYRINSQANSMITPKFVYKNFLLTNYTQLRDKKQVIYSDAFFYGPLQWRLKIYPNGLQKPNTIIQQSTKRLNSPTNFIQQYISIYIQLVTGTRDTARYQFTIQIINQQDNTKVISQIYEANFNAGKCWGYDQFANITTLYQKGYINHNQDSLKIAVSVGSPSYYHYSLDQQHIIQQKQCTIQKNRTRIQQLKNALNRKYEIQAAHSIRNTQHILKNTQSNNQPIINKSSTHPIVLQQQLLSDDIKTPTNRQLNKILAKNGNQDNQPKIQIINRQQVQKQKQNQNQKQSIYPVTHTYNNQTNPIYNQQNNHHQQQNKQKKQQKLSINYQNYKIQYPQHRQQYIRGNQQFDHQSAQLRKIFRRIMQVNQRNNLLLF